jgi:hypothetical protein
MLWMIRFAEVSERDVLEGNHVEYCTCVNRLQR